MRRFLLALPGLMSDWDESPLRQNLPALQELTSRSKLVRFQPASPSQTPEEAWFGLPPGTIRLAQGPLMVAALRADPPQRSTHFHLSLLSQEAGTVCTPQTPIHQELLDAIWPEIERLNTRKLTALKGEGRDHALVWEDFGDFQTTAPSTLLGSSFLNHLPEGDGEKDLRRLIDDSMNLLSELPLNRERIEEGLQPINLLWPWGEGVRTPVPNLFFKRGEHAMVVSDSMRLEGLAWLSSYRHASRAEFRKGLKTRWSWLFEQAMQEPLTVAVSHAFEELFALGRLEEAHWLMKEIDTQLLSPLLALRESVQFSFIAGPSLGLRYQSERPQENWIPFDERALEEKTVPQLPLWEWIGSGF